MASSARKPPSTNIAYSYLGGGVEWQPPSTYALVTRGMPLHIADRYFALLTFLARGSVYKHTFVRKQRAKHRQQLDEEEKKTVPSKNVFLSAHTILITSIDGSELLNIYCIGPACLALKTKHAS